ncbi:MAG: hypothetical protein ACP5R2_11760, partial [Anaerolineae bacterium]
MTTMIALVGEQPIPNLLPVRYLKPEALALVYTRRTEPVAKRLQRLLAKTKIHPVEISDAYRVAEIRDRIQTIIAGQSDLLFNLTGGTKTMAFAAYDLARQSRSPFLYFQTEGPHGRDQRSLLYRYAWQGDEAELEERIELSEALITLDDYLSAHFDGYKITGFSTDQGGILERAVHAALKEYVDEIIAGVRPHGMKDQIEIDLAVRCDNQVGFIEVKEGGGESGKDAIDQLTTAAARELSGIYAARFIVTGVTQDERYRAV